MMPMLAAGERGTGDRGTPGAWITGSLLTLQLGFGTVFGTAASAGRKKEKRMRKHLTPAALERRAVPARGRCRGGREGGVSVADA